MTSNLMAPRGAVALLSVFGRLDGISEIRWAMPNGEKEMTVQMTGGPTLLQRTWDLLDIEVDKIKVYDGKSEQGVEYHKTRARAIADVLAMFMVPHFTTSDEISREAMKRWQARQAGDTEYETKGLGSRRYEPAEYVPLRSSAAPKAPAKKAAAKRRTGNSIPPQAVQTSKQGIESGMFTATQIGQMYHMTAAEVKEQLGLA